MLGILPFLWLGCLWIKYYYSDEDKHEKAFNFLSKEDDVTKNRTSVEIPEPSSIEFQKIFIKLLDEVKNNNNKKLIVVMDNLDRINAKDALKMWSTMRTIFNLPHREKSEERLWLIVPFDENAIKELWEDEKSKSQNIGKSFLEKTFQIEFKVSSPVLSDWRKYFIDNMKLALPNHSSEEFHDLYKVFSLGRVQINQNKSISPREIKKIINKLGSLHRQWQDEIQLVNMMLYVVLNEYQNWEPKKDLVNTNFAEKLNDLRLKNYITDDWQKELAALHLNVKKDKAIEMILEPRIDRIIKKCEYKEVEDISNTPGFTIILEDYLESLINEKENYSVEILKFTNIFSDINLDNSELELRIKKQIINYVEKSEEIKKLNTEISFGLIKLLNWKDNINFYNHVIKLVSETLPEKEEDKIIEEKIDEWTKAIKNILELILDRKNGSEIANKFYFSGNENDFIKVTEQLDLNNYPKKLYKYFTPEIEIDSIINTFNNDLKNKNFDLSYARAIKVINKVFPEFDGKSIVNNINNNMRNTNNNYNSDEYRTLLKILLNYRNNNDLLFKLIKDGFIFYHLQRVKNDNKTIALTNYILILENPKINISIGNGSIRNNAKNSLKLVKDIINNPEKNDKNKEVNIMFLERYKANFSFSDLINIYKENNNLVNLFKFSISHFINNDLDYIKINDVINNWNFINKNVDKKVLNKLFKKLDEHKKELFSKIMNTKFKYEKADLYLLIVDNIENISNQFLNYIYNGLKNNIDKNIWLKELKNNGILVQILVKLNDFNLNLELNNKLSDAVFDHFKSLFNNKIEVPADKKRYIIIIDSIKK